jgi:hypothetical protein
MHLPVTCRPCDGTFFPVEMPTGESPPSEIVPVRWGASMEFWQAPEPGLADHDAVFAGAQEGLHNRCIHGQDRQAESVLSDQLGKGAACAGGGRGGARP